MSLKNNKILKLLGNILGNWAIGAIGQFYTFAGCAIVVLIVTTIFHIVKWLLGLDD